MTLAPELATAAATAAAAAAGWRCALPRLAEPDTAGEPKVPYRALATGRHTLLVGLLAAAAAVLPALLLPAEQLPLWLVLALLGVPLAVIDALTTWIPASLTRLGWAATVPAAAAAAALGASWTDLLRAAGGALAAGLLFGLVWLASRGGFGFGDVRYVPLIGAAAAAESWTLLAGALLFGSLLAAVHAMARRLLRVDGMHPWTPGLLAGCYTALLLNQLIPTL